MRTDRGKQEARQNGNVYFRENRVKDTRTDRGKQEARWNRKRGKMLLHLSMK
jgi:hypothetical protein